ncbi:MAG: DAK2 domain-containing protein, partial [Mycoplasmataceae bacterium]|nr:DAK2 domain-containing protein [Mycoplasmataceae bacterium]
MSKSKNAISTVNVELFKKMYFYALISVSRREDKINRLNVFPVPDGDTGSNVLNTIAGGWENIKDKEFSTIAELSAAFAKGSLLGARGNSGVISSQIYKGIAVGLKDAGKTMSPAELKDAFLVAKEYAYKAVSNPIEGTILSVVSEIAKEAPKYEFDNFSTLLESAYLVADHAVMNTPNQMKVLKDANVVDSGAYSLQRFLHGFRKAVSNEEYSISEQDYTKVEENAQRTIAKKAPTKSVAGYC